MRSVATNYMGMIAIAVVAVLVIGAVAVRIDRSEEVDPPPGISATPAMSGNAPAGLVDVGWLSQYRSQVDYIFDLSDLREYESGHIPGAIHVWWQDAMGLHANTYTEPDRLSFDPSRDTVFDVLQLSVPQNSRIVLYDNQDSERASWLLWVMTINGYTDVHVLDGGISAWIGADGDLSTDVEDSRDQALVATPVWNENVQIRREPLRDSLDDPNLQLIDTRSEEELEDDVNGTIRTGYIPGSINIPTSEIMREDGTFKSEEELREIFESHGLDPNEPVVVYSLFTAQSGNMWLALQIAGYNDASIYMEGYAAWGKNDDLPIETLPYPVQDIVATPGPATHAATPVATPLTTPEADATPAATPDEDEPTDLTGD